MFYTYAIVQEVVELSPIGMVHDIAALVMIACLLLPFSAVRFLKRSPEEAIAKANKLIVWLRVPHIILIVSLISGFIRVGWHFSSWLIGVLIIFLVIAAMLGIISKTVKTIKQQAENNESFQASAQKFLRLSIVLAIAIIAMVVYKLV